MDNNSLESPHEQDPDFDKPVSVSEWMEGRTDDTEDFMGEGRIDDMEDFMGEGTTYLIQLKAVGLFMTAQVAFYNVEEQGYGFPWDLPTWKFQANYWYLVYLLAISIPFLCFYSGYRTTLPIPSRAKLSPEEYRQELLNCIRSTFGGHHFLNWFGVPLECTAFLERYCIAVLIADPRLQQLPLNFYNKGYCSWLIMAITSTIFHIIQLGYAEFHSTLKLDWSHYFGCTMFLFYYCGALLVYRSIGWHWRQAIFVQLIRQECLKNDVPGGHDLEKGKRGGLNAKEQIEWWMWDILKAEPGDEEEELREVRMSDILNEIEIQA